MHICVALACCNGEAHLPQQLHSLATQTRPPDALVVCDDASSDQTPRVVQDFAAAAPFPVHWHQHPQRLGVRGNFQSAIERCSGDIIALCDQDDIWLPHKLQRIEQTFTQRPDALAVFSDLTIADAAMQPLSQTQWQRLRFSAAERRLFDQGRGFIALLRRNLATGTAMAFRSSARRHVLPIPAPWIHDEWIAIVLAALGPVLALPEPLVLYRQHAGQQIGGGAAGLVTQWSHARQRMNAGYFNDLVLRAQALVQRLEQLHDQLADAGDLDLARQRLAHVQRRRELRQSPLRRVSGSVREAMTGNYRRFGYGWKSFAQDLLL